MGLLHFSLLYSVWLFGCVHMQTCPSESGWVTGSANDGKKCYKFNAFPRLAQPQASASCQENGATLVSVNTPQENQFLTNYLLQNDPGRNTWLTSGINTKQGVQWLGDGTITTSYDKWLVPAAQRIEGQSVIFFFLATEYGWATQSLGTTSGYICEISVDEVYRIVQQGRDFDYGTNYENPGLAPRGPNFIREPQDVVILGNTDSVYLECIANGIPEPTYEWLVQKDQKMVPVIANNRYAFTTGKLEIRKPTTADESSYQCKARNEFGIILSATAPLSFGFLGDFSNVASAPVSGNEYDGVMMECPQIQARPAKSYQWYKDDFVVIRPNFQKHIFVSATGKLLFSELAVSDQGTYYCMVTLTSYGQKGNYVGASQTPSRNSLGFTLNVKSGGASQFQPKIQNDFIYVFPPNPTREGIVRLECFAYGTGPLMYSWSRAENKPLPTGHNFDSNNRILILNDVKLEDGGIYKCEVFSTVTNLKDERNISLAIQSKPYFTYPLTSQHIDIGRRLTWHCEANGQPTPTYQWLKNGQILTSSAGVTVTVNTLTIEAVNAERDNGMYQCEATNQYGTTYSSAQLRVLKLAPSFTKSPMQKIISASLTGNVTLICNPMAAPFPTFKWLKDGSPLAVEVGQYQDADHYKLLLNGNLIISRVVNSDQGRYTCQVENTEGRAEDYSDLKVIERTVLSQFPTDQRVEVNLTATLLCQASYSPTVDLIYLWKFNDHVIDYTREPEYRLGEGNQKGSLYIIATQFSNEGKYICIATTGMDQISASAFLTVIGPPGEPAGVYISERPPIVTGNVGNLTNLNTSRWVIWTDGMDRGSSITHYFVEFRTDLDLHWRVHPDGNNVPKYAVTNEQFPNKRYIQLNNLKAGAGIEFRVKARNSFGIGPPSLPTPVTQIPGAIPTAVVTNVRGGGGSVGELTIVWDPLPLEDHNGPDLKYIVWWRLFDPNKQADNSTWSKGEITDSAACKYKLDYVSLRGQAFLCSYVVLVGPKVFYTLYGARVQAANQLGNGPPSNESMIMSAEEMPLGAPETAIGHHYNSTALRITWNPVPNTRENVRGLLKGYKINYWRSWIDNEAQALQNIVELKPGQTNLKEALIIGLEPFTWYTFNVQAYSSAGNGPKSSSYDQQTLNKVPNLFPTEVYVYSIEGYGVRVTFRGVSTQVREEPLRGYKVQYWKSNENILSAREVDFGKLTTGVIRNLSSSELYELRVYGYSRGGQGKRSSPTVYFTVGEGQIQINTETTEIMNAGPAVTISIYIMLVAAIITFCSRL